MQTPSILRKTLYIFDMLMLGIMTLVTLHCGFWHARISFFMVMYLLLLRANMTFLLYRRERKTIWPMAVFSILFVLGYYLLFARWLDKTGYFLASLLRMETARYIYWSLVGVFAWLLLMPWAAWLVQYFGKKSEKHDIKWNDLAGGAIFHDKAGRMFVASSAVFITAIIIGRIMDDQLSFYAMPLIAIVFYYLINKYIIRKAHWLEYLLVFFAMMAFDLAQWRYGNPRIILLAVGSAFALAVSVWMFAQSKRLVASIIVFVALAFALPVITMGYNVFRCTEAARLTNYSPAVAEKYYCKETEYGVMFTRSGDFFGMRDRYHEILPCQYSKIIPIPNKLRDVRCVTNEGDTLIYSLNTKKFYKYKQYKH